MEDGQEEEEEQEQQEQQEHQLQHIENTNEEGEEEGEGGVGRGGDRADEREISEVHCNGLKKEVDQEDVGREPLDDGREEYQQRVEQEQLEEQGLEQVEYPKREQRQRFDQTPEFDSSPKRLFFFDVAVRTKERNEQATDDKERMYQNVEQATSKDALIIHEPPETCG